MKIYIACPNNYVTGGIELLHQLCHELNQNPKIDAKMWYIAKYIEHPQPDVYSDIYGNEYVTAEAVEKDSVIVFPEIWADRLERFDSIQKVIFWESVDNYLRWSSGNNVASMPKNILHLTQSAYASDFLINNGIDAKQIIYIGDYINHAYLSNPSVTERRDIVLYNPKKGKAFTDLVIKALPEIEFIPIQNMTQQEVIKLMDKSKLYIDFGDHPGKDRLPREAAMRDLCIITDKEGSARFKKDVNIPDEYKFNRDEAELDSICGQIKATLEWYELRKEHFTVYRNNIMCEYSEFKAGIDAFIQRLHRPRFSVIIPAYNSEKHIGKALESVRQQVFTDYELIVVCDSCTDNTEAVAKSYGATVFTVENHCDGPTRNKGIEEAHGEYILFMDDDDWWLHEYVLTQLDEKLRETNADILCFSFIFKHWMYAKPKKPDGDRWIATWNKAWKRECIGDSRFSNAHSISDVQFHRQMFSKKLKVVEWDMPMYYYNFMRKGSQTEIDRRK